MKWTWRDVDEIAIDLAERHSGLDASSESILEAIQAAWYDEFED
jgi:Fe-S-cluster formation regulator IscX/YfhJ